MKLDPDYPYFPFHPEAKQTIVAKILTEDKKKLPRELSSLFDR